MALSPELSRRLHQTLGAEAAADFMNWMQDVEGQRKEVRATLRADIAELRQEMHGRFADLRQEMDGKFVNLRERMDTRFAATDATIAALREEMRTGFAALETRFERRFGDLLNWSFVFWVGAVGAVAMLAGVLP